MVLPFSADSLIAIIVFIAFSVFAGGLPEPVGLKIKGLLHTEKGRESVPVARPTLRGLRIAQSDRTSNAEAHADMQIRPTAHGFPAMRVRP